MTVGVGEMRTNAFGAEASVDVGALVVGAAVDVLGNSVVLAGAVALDGAELLG